MPAKSAGLSVKHDEVTWNSMSYFYGLPI